jgi:hypothetical protein
MQRVKDERRLWQLHPTRRVLVCRLHLQRLLLSRQRVVMTFRLKRMQRLRLTETPLQV